MDGGQLAVWLDVVARELALFAAIGLLVGGIDDLAVDLIYLGHRRTSRAPDDAPPQRRLAVFVPAWREAEVIGPMLRRALATLVHPDYRIYVGTYPNDPATVRAVAAVAAADPRVRLVIGERPGPTTKGDNLNAMLRALERDERAEGWAADAIVLHDAEDVPHPEELAVFDRLLGTHPLVQLPVAPLIARDSRWVSAHYADEFALTHDRTLIVREALGAGLPLAGVGCAIRRDALAALAAARGGLPFDPDSLVEDYELGLTAAALGFPGHFARVRDADGGLVCVRAFFPTTVGGAVRQKARWMTGIALDGWDRLGWGGTWRWGELWMRMRDRRAPLAMAVLAAAYGALLCAALAALAHVVVAATPPPPAPLLTALLLANSAMLVWRLAARATATARLYGWREGVRAMPRMVVSNFIALAAARRALTAYLGSLAGRPLRWDKTEHRFPVAGEL